MISLRLLATAALATGVLSLAPNADAAPNGAAAGPRSGQIVQIEYRTGGRDREDWLRRDGGRERRSDRRGRDYRSRDRDQDWGRDRQRDERRYYDDNGHRHGWEKQVRWRVERHPRRQYWVGRQLPYDRYVVIYNYDDYYLPPPRRGFYYARIDNDIYLVAAATRSIIDAFLLFGAVGR